MRWKKGDMDRELVKEMAAHYGLDLLSAAILVRRGIRTAEEVKFYLEDELTFAHNPFLFDEMEETVDRILLAAEEGERIRIFGDRDVDGISSTVLLREQLVKLGLEVSWSLPEGDDPYGMTKAAVDLMESESETLLITVDCGITNYEEIAYAREKGIDTIIVDHHNPSEQLPSAVAIINPKVPDCGYPFQGLAAVGVTAKLIWALSFSQTDFYKEELVLLNLRPGNGTIIFEAVKLENLVEQDRLSESFVPGVVKYEQTRLGEFLEGKQILVYDRPMQERFLKQLFGNNIEIGVIDLAEEIWRIYPALKDESLLRIRERSRSSRYEGKQLGEIESLVNLFRAYVIKRYDTLTSGFDNILDLVALGTLADMMPLEDENRILVRRGMKVLSEARRGAVHDLLLQQNLLGKRLSTTDVGWQINPVINATGRLGVPGKAAQFFLEEDPKRRGELSGEIIGLNRERKKLGEIAWKNVFPQAKRSFKESGERFILVEEKEIHRGVTGIIATRLMQHFSVPAAVIAHLDDHLVGSVRSTKGLNVKNFLGRFADLFLDYGGHDMAAGFSLKRENLDELIRRFKEEIGSLDSLEVEEAYIDVDAELPPGYLKPELLDLVERFEPYGEKSAPLVFLARRVKIRDLSSVGKSDPVHLKMLVDAGQTKWPAIFWRSADRVNKDFSEGDEVNILFRLGRNYYQNREQPQLTILDIERI
jgi:single-stranded-DNA-specific exonuclease